MLNKLFILTLLATSVKYYFSIRANSFSGSSCLFVIVYKEKDFLLGYK